jgi:nicotinamide-nucleotide amidase
MHAVILSIGDELVLGQTVDTNSAWLAQQLVSHGIQTAWHQTLCDEQPGIVRALRQAAEDADFVLVSGGLGPTEDDLTREALAEAMGVDLVVDAASLAQLEAFFARRNRPMPQRNRVQAMHPRGSSMIVNHHGTAPGLKAGLGRAVVYVMPGVPREMQHMFTDSVLPELAAAAGDLVILTTRINTFGLGESDLAQRLGDLMVRERNPKVGTTVSDGFCCVRIRSEFPDHATAATRLDATVEAVTRAVGPTVFGRDEQTLAENLVALLKQEHLTVATAESCTGGLVGTMITDVPGSSAVYRGGWVTYSDAMKAAQLGVPEDMLAVHGAVSEPVVRAMAAGALHHSGAELAVSLTGIAGPDGGTPDKPVGTVWIGLAARRHDGGTHVEAALVRNHGDRAAIRDRSAKCALQMLRFHIMGVPLDEVQWLKRAGPLSSAPTA